MNRVLYSYVKWNCNSKLLLKTMFCLALVTVEKKDPAEGICNARGMKAIANSLHEVT